MLQDNLRAMRQYYYRAPQFVKNILGGSYRCLPETLLLGESYREFTRLLEQASTWSKQQVEDYQFEQLRATLTVAYDHIPFYQQKYRDYGVAPSDFCYLNDIALFPTITKSEVKQQLQAMQNPQIPKWKHLTTTTGGSTAEPMRFYQLKGVTRSKEKAFIADGWRRVGYRHGVKTVQLKGRPVGDPQKGIFWEYEPIQNILEMDSNHLTPENIPRYWQAIQKFNPEFIIGFASSLYFFAKYLKQQNLTAPAVKAVMLASENVYPWQRDFLQAIFGCRIFSHYGHSEMVLLGMESVGGHDLLFFPQYGYLEILAADGRVKTRVGESGELVGTSFHNPLMPFIRYRTQDMGTIGTADSHLPHYPVLRDVEGRLQEFIITSDGRPISVCTIGAAHFDTLDTVLETQYYQDQPGKMQFRLVPRADFSERDRLRIHRALQQQVGSGMDIEVVTVPNIQRTSSGKHMMLVQKIEHRDFNFEQVD